jgi:hypothetical protein
LEVSLALARRHIALAGLVGLTLALILTPASHSLGVGGVIYTVVALVSNKVNEDLKPKGYNIDCFKLVSSLLPILLATLRASFHPRSPQTF